jgi:urease accessory protein UreE
VLERGTVLRGGDCFVLDDRAVVVLVVERAEPVVVITPQSPEEWGLYAYHIGNNHLPLMLEGGDIVCPDVPGLEQLLEQHGIRFSRATRAFTPVGAVPDHRHSG